MSEAQPTAPAQTSVGATLRRQREAQQLGIQEVANRMRLEPRIISALEADDHAALPAALYVRGYLRGYARLLRLDPDALVAVYDGAAPQAPPEIVPEARHPAQRKSSDRPVKAFTYLVSFTLVLLVVAWWQGNFMVPEPVPEAAPAPALPPPGLSYPITVVEHPRGPFFRAPLVEEAPSPAESAGAVRTSAGGPDRIRLSIESDSWVEIFDAGGGEIMVGLARAGEVFELGGQAPFDVLLGYAPGVRLEFNGRRFDAAPQSRSGVARFTLKN